MSDKRRITRSELPRVRVALLKRQGGVCPLCLTPLTVKTACVDHDHATGQIRGALCRNCNQMEGKVFNLANRAKRHDVAKNWLGRLIKYWITHETDQTGLLHPLHKTDEEKRELRNKRARQRRASAKKTSS